MAARDKTLHEPVEAGAGQEPEYVFDEPCRLSKSRLWELQRRFFERKGAAAWGERIVPSYITTNPFVANAYAQVILGFLRDWQRARGAAADSPPVHIVELGSGAGLLGFNLVRALTDSLAHSPFPAARFRYVLTDLASANLDFWGSHPALQPFVEAGTVDFALYDAEHPAPLALRHSRELLVPGALPNPLVLVANYFFDSIPQDAFYLENGELYESLLKLTFPRPDLDLDSPDFFKQVNLVYHRQPASVPAYDDPDFNRILDGFRAELNDTAIDFPSVALESLRFFRSLSGDRLLLLTGDKGYDRPEELARRKEPGYAVHGSFSMMVNYAAIARYFENADGEVLRTSYRYSGLNILAMALGLAGDGLSETRHAFHEAIEKHGPDDYFNLGQGAEAAITSMGLEQILSYLRFSGWDSHLFFKCFPTLLEQIGAASERLKGELIRAIEELWNAFYYVGDESDMPFDLGMLLFKLGDHKAALRYFDISLRMYGPAASTYYNQAVCLYRFDRNGEALQAVDRALELRPDMEQAHKLRKAIVKDMQK